MVISWWRTWWRRQRSRARQRPVWLRQRGLGLENLEDRRLLSAVLASDPILRTLDAAQSPTAHVTLVAGNPSTPADNAVDAGTTTALSAALHTATGGDRALPRHRRAHGFPGLRSVDSGAARLRDIQYSPITADPGPVPVSSDLDHHAESIGSSSSLDATYAAELNPVAGDATGDRRVPWAGVLDQGPEPLKTDALPVSLDDAPTPASTSDSNTPSTTTDASELLLAIAPDSTTNSYPVLLAIAPDSGAGASLPPMNSVPASASPLAPMQGVAVDLPLDQNSQDQGATGDLSGGNDGATAGTVAIAPVIDASGSLSVGDLAPENPGPGKRGVPNSGSGTANSGDRSTGLGEDTRNSLDNNAASQKGGGKTSGNTNGQGNHSDANQDVDWDDPDDVIDPSTSSLSHRSGQHGSRGRSSDDGATRTATDQASPVASPVAEVATGSSIDTSARQTGGSDPSTVVSPGIDAAAELSATITVAAVRHRHHRVGPRFFPTISAADLSYTVAGWDQGADAGMDGTDGYFTQSYDFTTKVGDVSGFRSDSLARADKARNLVDKADWRYLGTSLRGASGMPVLIGWGNSGAVLSPGEGAVEGLDLVYSIQAAVNRGVGVTGAHRVPARAANHSDQGLGDRNRVLTDSAVFLAAHSPQVGDASSAGGQSVQQVVASALAEVGQGSMAHLVTGSFQAQHLKTDGETPDSSQRLDGHGWWSIVAQFILAPQFPHNHQPTIMLAVADEPSRDALNIALVKANFMVLTAATAREAMKLLRTPLSPVDVALLDVHLPDVNGVDLCSRLRELYPTLPVLVCTDQAEQGDVSQLEKLNVLRVFSKPVAVGELLAAVKGIVS